MAATSRRTAWPTIMTRSCARFSGSARRNATSVIDCAASRISWARRTIAAKAQNRMTGTTAAMASGSSRRGRAAGRDWVSPDGRPEQPVGKQGRAAQPEQGEHRDDPVDGVRRAPGETARQRRKSFWRSSFAGASCRQVGGLDRTQPQAVSGASSTLSVDAAASAALVRKRPLGPCLRAPARRRPGRSGPPDRPSRRTCRDLPPATVRSRSRAFSSSLETSLRCLVVSSVSSPCRRYPLLWCANARLAAEAAHRLIMDPPYRSDTVYKGNMQSADV